MFVQKTFVEIFGFGRLGFCEILDTWFVWQQGPKYIGSRGPHSNLSQHFDFLVPNLWSDFCSEFWLLGDVVFVRSWRLGSSGPHWRTIFLNMLFRKFLQNFCSEFLFRILVFGRLGSCEIEEARFLWQP